PWHQFHRQSVARHAPRSVAAACDGLPPAPAEGNGADAALRRAAVGVRQVHRVAHPRARRCRHGPVSAAQPIASAAGSIPEKKVLIVDDSKFVRTTFNRILSTQFAVRECPNGEEGWQAIETDPSIVMIVSDIDMPKLDGFGLLQRVRGAKDERIRSMPVI